MIELSDKAKDHIVDSFKELFASVSQGKEAFRVAFKKHLKNLDPEELLEEHLREGGKEKGQGA